MANELARFPDRVRGPAGAPPYRRLEDRYALLGIAAGAAPANAELTLEGGSVAVMRGAPPAAAPAGARLVAVYAAGAAQAPCVPTGRVLVRFAETERAVDRRRDVERCGCVIVEALAYAPQAAWVTAASGAVDDALRAVDALAALPGVAGVEPQMLSRSVKR